MSERGYGDRFSRAKESVTARYELTLTEFLLARIAEDEIEARTLTAYSSTSYDGLVPTHVKCSPSRLLAECEAKRRIVERARVAQDGADLWTRERLKTDTRDPLPEWARRDAYAEVLRDLAAVYADHPDYRDEWRD